MSHNATASNDAPAYPLSWEELALRFKALGHPVRLRIFARLAQCCPKDGVACEPAADGSLPCVGEISEAFGIPASTLSHHLKELERAGLILRNREGTSIRCRVDLSAVAALTAFFTEIQQPHK